ncbi:MAG: NAD(P)H-quinone oxidoreductase [Caldilineaceae bacterium]|nr:NAD(P)H-quinone oxidoreductase [Caldilineaceae bacterium]
MYAINVVQQDGQPHLVWAETDDPTFGPDEVLVDVHATALNRADLSQAAGNYPPPPGASPILGLDMAGVIAEVGADVTGWQRGDRVCALLTGGGYAEKVAVPAAMLMPIPAGWDFETAAAMPEVYLTAFLNIFMEANFQLGETVLIHGGASGVGTAAIQMVKAAGGTVIATAGKADKVQVCRDLGADLAIHYNEEDFVARTQEFTDGAGVDVILDMVGASYLQRNISLLKIKGRLVFIATLGGAVGEINIGQLMGKRARLIGSVLRARPVAEKTEIIRRFRTQFWSHFEDGSMKPIIGSVYPVQEAQAAHDAMRAYENIGKIVFYISSQ